MSTPEDYPSVEPLYVDEPVKHVESACHKTFELLGQRLLSLQEAGTKLHTVHTYPLDFVRAVVYIRPFKGGVIAGQWVTVNYFSRLLQNDKREHVDIEDYGIDTKRQRIAKFTSSWERMVGEDWLPEGSTGPILHTEDQGLAPVRGADYFQPIPPDFSRRSRVDNFLKGLASSAGRTIPGQPSVLMQLIDRTKIATSLLRTLEPLSEEDPLPITVFKPDYAPKLDN